MRLGRLRGQHQQQSLAMMRRMQLSIQGVPRAPLQALPRQLRLGSTVQLSMPPVVQRTGESSSHSSLQLPEILQPLP